MDFLEYDINSPTHINVTLPPHIVTEELKILRNDPFKTFYIGNHRVFVCKEKRTDEVKRMQYIGLFWLMHNREEPSLECKMHVDVVSKFVCYKLALMLVALKFATVDHEMKIDEEKYKCVQVVHDEDVNKENISFRKLDVHTHLFGVLRAPTMEEMDAFLGWAKITNLPIDP